MRHIFKAMAIGGVEAGILLSITLFVQLERLRHLVAPGTATISLGPLDLLQIDKFPLHSGGFSLNFSLLKGLLVLYVVCFGSELALLLWLKQQHRPRSPSSLKR